jgi:uncharacterized membrane protein
MMTEDFTKDVLSQIKDQKLAPRPRWQFTLKNYLLWALVGLATILGALAVTTIIFILTDYDWDVFVYLNRSFLVHVLMALPYLWLASLTLILVTIYYNFRHTKGGYHYEPYKIIGLSVFASLVLGTIMFWCGLDSEIHECLVDRLPLYGHLVQTNRDLWIYPEHGLLAGHITLFNDSQGFVFQDLHGTVWVVATDTQTIWDNRLHPATNTIIKLIGERQDAQHFRVRNIRPWNNRLPNEPMK